MADELDEQREQLTKLDPIANADIPDGWRIDARTSPSSGQLQFFYERADHPLVQADREAESGEISVYGNDGTYTVKCPWLGLELWTDDVWRVVDMFETCFYCATNRYDQHGEEHENIFEVVSKIIEQKRMKSIVMKAEGMGPKTAEKLLNRYRKPQHVLGATREELELIPGIGTAISGRIWDALMDDLGEDERKQIETSEETVDEEQRPSYIDDSVLREPTQSDEVERDGGDEDGDEEYVCECGRGFERSPQLRGHQRHCDVHLEKKEREEDEDIVTAE